MIVLDTHIWFWMVTQDWKRFPSAWHNDIELADQVGVSPISCYEIVLAEERGRLELPCAAEDWFRDALESMDIVLLPLNAAVACRAVELSPVHKDPFDRLIIATALVYDGRLASVDGSFSLYPEIKNRLLGS